MNASKHLNPPDIDSAMKAGLTVAQGLLDASIPLTPQQLCDLRSQARLRLEAGQHEQAREFCRQILHRDSQDAEALQILGACAFDLNAFASPPLTVRRPEVSLPTFASATPHEIQLPDLTRNLRAAREKSPGGFDEEISFWDRELSLKGSFAEDMRKRATDPQKVFPQEITPYLDELRKTTPRPRVLDPGSGPLSYLAWGHQQGTIEVVAADPLAPIYLELLHKHRLRPTAPLVKCFGEELSIIFGPESFDLIYMRNALDHSQSPAAVFRELAQVLRPGGYLYLMGTVREATRMNWAGLHQHDLFMASGGRLMDEHRASPGSDTLVTECISDGYPIQIVKCNAPTDVSGQWLSVIWRKSEARAAETPQRGTSLVPAKRPAKPRSGRKAQ